MSDRNSTSNLIKTLLLELNKAPGSIADLSKRSGINFNSTKNYLEMLFDSNIVSREITDNKIIYKLNQMATNDNDSYFGIPFNNNTKKKVFSYYNYITKKWKELTTKPISRTQIQKVLFKVNKNFKLELPFGWYKYGQACAIFYDEHTDYSQYKIDIDTEIQTEINNNLKKTINETTYKTKYDHYVDERNPVYIAKEEIIRDLNSNIEKININEITNKYNMILDTEYKKIDRNTLRMLEDYSELLKELFSNNLKLEEIINDIRLSFNIVWDLIALYLYKNDLKKYADEGLVENCFAPYIIDAREKVIDICKELDTSIPRKQTPKSENYLKLKAIQQKMLEKIKANEKTYE